MDLEDRPGLCADGIEPLVVECDKLSSASLCQPEARAAQPRPAFGNLPCSRRVLAAGLAVVAIVMVAAALSSPRQRAGGLKSRSSSELLTAYGDAVATMGAAMQYNETTAAAMAVLAKLSYCDGKPGLYASVLSGCSGPESPCAEAGVQVTGSVRTVSGNNAFAFVVSLEALATGDLTARPEANLIVFRGSLDTAAEMARDVEIDLLDFQDPGIKCPGAGVHAGFYQSWDSLRQGVLAQLGPPGGKPAACTGHGTGAALCALALYELNNRGYQVLSSYGFSMPAPGNVFFAACFAEAFGGLKPFFRITHGADLTCALPGSRYAHIGAEVHYPSDSRGKFSVCRDGDQSCGCAQYEGSVSPSRVATCTSGLAPEANFCGFGNFGATCYLGQGFGWQAYGSPASQPPPLPVGFSGIVQAETTAAPITKADIEAALAESAASSV